LRHPLGLSKLIAFYDENGISIYSEKRQMRQWIRGSSCNDQSLRLEVIAEVDGQ